MIKICKRMKAIGFYEVKLWLIVSHVKYTINLEEFLDLPETQPASEYLKGEITQKPMPPGENSTLQIRLGTVINEAFLPPKLAHAFTELWCDFGGQSLVTDISVFTWERIPRTEKRRIANRFEVHPDWVIEILSPEQSANQVIRKIMFCLSQGTQLGWLVDPKDESVMILKPDSFPEVKLGEDILPVWEHLKKFQLSAREMFAWLSLDNREPNRSINLKPSNSHDD
ncbi:Uma2 family endonuclease [Limnospira sp. PMC 1042.18]|uniref:Uma2 family endonuclease n=1 Tax=Limnospira sp. PMC 1042.18 TaxID=2981018 RepID=UPI0028E0F0B6|nr:Uma2 family endonuclease [Limnospira sp. PMC 1042.18]MDT9199437.1 Uma2 family endonuclease [Limnospira sp. PMC 1042.18]